MSHQGPMKFKPSETKIATEREAISRILSPSIVTARPIQEIASVEHIPVGTVKSRINRARARIMAAREKTK